MEKLEFKHLVPYLPYNLGMYGCQSKMSCDTLQKFIDDEWDIIPILRPLSDLELDEFENKIFNREYIIDKETESDLSYYEWCFLFENHFDVFGLIEKGLAIDINTLNK